MKVLVTGSTGYIGSHLTFALSQEHEVYVIVRETSNTTKIKDCVKKIIFYKKECIYDQLAEIEPDVLVHLAGVFYGEHTPDNIENLLESNVMFSAIIFDAAVAVGCRKIINTGTYWQHFSGEIYNPVNLYAATKQAGEDILLYYVKAKGCRAITLQIFDSYGPNDHRNKILNIIQRLDDGAQINMSSGQQKIYYCHVEDLVRGYVRALEILNGMKIGEYAKFALRDEKPIPLRTLIEDFLKIQQKNIKINWGACAYRSREIMDPSGIGTILPGWKPEHKWEQSVKKL